MTTAAPAQPPKLPEFEKRARSAGKIEIRQEGDDGPVTLVGRAIVYNTLSHSMYGFREKIQPGAFTKSIGEGGDDIRFLAYHDSGKVLARESAGTLKLNDTDEGLDFEAELPNTSVARDLVESIRRGDIDGMSFGFNVNQDSWDRTDEEGDVRTVIEGRVREISAVAFPAYPATDVEARSFEMVAQHGRSVIEAKSAPEPMTEARRETLELMMAQAELK